MLRSYTFTFIRWFVSRQHNCTHASARQANNQTFPSRKRSAQQLIRDLILRLLVFSNRKSLSAQFWCKKHFLDTCVPIDDAMNSIAWPNYIAFNHLLRGDLFFFVWGFPFMSILRENTLARTAQCASHTHTHTNAARAHTAHTPAVSCVYILTIYGLNPTDCVFVRTSYTIRTYFVMFTICVQVNERNRSKKKKKRFFRFPTSSAVPTHSLSLSRVRCPLFVHARYIHTFLCCVFIAKLL